MPNLTTDNIYILQQGITVLHHLSDTLYTETHAVAFNATVGSHFRHTFDFYACFLHGLESGQVDYNLRQRQEQFIQDRHFALTQLSQTIAQLEQLPDTIGNNTVSIREDTIQWSHSTVFRELQFLLSHTVHHYALIAIMLRLRGFETGSEFGIAPSTLRYWQEQQLS